MSDADRDELAERVAQLEQVVASQQQALRRLLPDPDRRDVLKGVGGAIVGGAGVFAATGGASGQATDDGSAGNVGTPDRTQDVWLDQLFDANDNEILNVDPGEPVNAQPRNWVFSEINGGGPIVDGDGIAREQYLIANGAGDPADADADDLIYEEEA